MKSHIHIARWLLIFGGLVVLYYFYKSIMAQFNAVVTTATAPITGAENIVNNVVSGVKNGVSALYTDITSLAGAIVGSPTSGTSDTQTAAVMTPSIVPGQNTTPQDIATYSGVDTQNLPYTWDLTSMGIAPNP